MRGEGAEGEHEEERKRKMGNFNCLKLAVHCTLKEMVCADKMGYIFIPYSLGYAVYNVMSLHPHGKKIGGNRCHCVF